MDLFNMGTKVLVKGTEIKAVTTGVCARGNDNITYEIAWWINGERKEVWVYDFEIELYVDNSKKAGFKTYQTDNLIS